MIRMVQSQSAGHAKAYFNDALSKSDYYVNDQELAGQWQGRLADRLGVDGVISKEAFFALCENKHPATGESLTPRNVENRTTGYDINFHCPKSVSVMHAMTNDGEILEAFEKSVYATMQLIEADSKTRVRKDGADSDRETKELAWANFVHQTARPVDGSLPDPHLHSHCFVFNATWDEQEKVVKAAQFRDIKRDMPYYQSVFQKTLADNLADLGYGIRKTAKSFEIENVPQQVLDLFSKRTDEIGRVAKDKGITDAKELSELGARTRAKKQKGHTMDELKDEWRSQIEKLGNNGHAGIVRHAPTRNLEKVSAIECVDYAILHCFERSSVMSERRLLESAYRYSMGKSGATGEDIKRAFESDDRIVKLVEKDQIVCTTREVLTEEKEMIDLAIEGFGKMKPLYDVAPELNLNGQQKSAVDHILTTRDRVSIIRGAAGTGKTTLMKEAVAKIKDAGKDVFVVAPTAQAARGILKEQEKFDNAQTVAKLLTDHALQTQLKGQVLWVDEAGMLGTKDMLGLLSLAKKHNAQLILGGDTRQHASVVRGDAMRVLSTVGGIRSAEVTKIYRQQTEGYRSAVEDLSNGHVLEGFQKLDELKFIKTVDAMNPNGQIVKDYLQAVTSGKKCLIVSPTHAQGDAVTAAVRQELQAAGLIGNKEIKAERLRSVGFTEAEKGDTRNFQSGQFVKFSQNVAGFGIGSLWEINCSNQKDILLVNAHGESKPFPVVDAKKYEVYEKGTILLAKGDKVLVNTGMTDLDNKRMENGTMLEVISIAEKGVIKLRNPISKRTHRVSTHLSYIDNGHCVTSQASQGKTVEEVFIYQPAATFPATDSKQFYVSVSRAKHQAHIYTDDKELLLEYAQDLGERQSAIEMLLDNKMHQEVVMLMQREKEQEQEIEIKTGKDHEPDR